MFRTNTNDTWRVAYDNLLSTSNNALVMSSAALGLGTNEFVTEIMYQFGTVRAGFRSVENPRIEGTVRDGLQNGYEFVNRIDLGGRVGSEWIVGNSVWQTRVFRPAPEPHPRTGWYKFYCLITKVISTNIVVSDTFQLLSVPTRLRQ
jgi:hypothetical protein